MAGQRALIATVRRTELTVRPPNALAAGFAAIALAVFPQLAAAQPSTSREVVQPLPSVQVERLNRALKELARRPDRLDPLLEAAEASLAVSDYDAAIGFFGRAAKLSPNDARVKLGTARTYLRAGRPVAALPLFAAAQAAGARPREVLLDRALAFDMVGDQEAAQAAYVRTLELDPENGEARRRLALSRAISGDADGFQVALAPLLEQRDFAAFRARAFGLAIMGEGERAGAIVEAVMPPDLAARIVPYLAFMPRLTPGQQAAAANLGIFPRAADIGQDSARVAGYADRMEATRTVALQTQPGRNLEPSGEPLGPGTASVSQEVAQPIAQPIAQAPAGAPTPIATTPVPASVAASAPISAPVSAPATIPMPPSTSAPTTREAAALPRIATTETGSPAADAAAGRITVEDRFGDLLAGDRAATAPTQGAVDLATIAIPREAPAAAATASSPVTRPPRRIWVQVATGQDLAALGFDWRRLARRAPELLASLTPHTVPWGEANRLLAGPLENEAAARTLINALAARGIDTFAYTSPEGTQIQRLE